METTFEHQSVLLNEVISLMAPKSGGIYCDGTLGGGGHAEQILEKSSPDGQLIGIDQDLNAIAAARKRLARFGGRAQIFHGRFSQLDELLRQAHVPKLDGLLLDLGVSSHQLDEASRGFSFMNAGPLDMRMDASAGESAKELLARISEDELADIIFKFGEERMARKVARSIKQMELAGTLETTGDLAVAVKRVVGQKRPGKSDPATKTFQAIRIAVNDEMNELESVLKMLPEPLAIGGCVAIITFHSLEDRMVKERFNELVNPCQCPPGMPVCTCPKPYAEFASRRSVRVSKHEIESNRRARSAKVRAIRRVR
ncbi:MAG: 16S rRNA (cytosine(1402)-N(4))-methyltransferase RsmH [Deltaproteobacteria bacterium]|nr:16S rRNA (cytosine(1402)-N(4))-methyltransferase RsmH [Deltaproteobacteria bacterium]MBN2673866.1 16S rRNA (cytosine(1402)-N(4))-methyltransferase RsmH [Deltaproteobacteria bacterium]